MYHISFLLYCIIIQICSGVVSLKTDKKPFYFILLSLTYLGKPSLNVHILSLFPILAYQCHLVAKSSGLILTSCYLTFFLHSNNFDITLLQVLSYWSFSSSHHQAIHIYLLFSVGGSLIKSWQSSNFTKPRLFSLLLSNNLLFPEN